MSQADPTAAASKKRKSTAVSTRNSSSTAFLSAVAPPSALPKTERTNTKRSKATIPCTDPDTQNATVRCLPLEPFPPPSRSASTSRRPSPSQMTTDPLKIPEIVSLIRLLRRTERERWPYPLRIPLPLLMSPMLIVEKRRRPLVASKLQLRRIKTYKPRTTTVRRGRKISAVPAHRVD